MPASARLPSGTTVERLCGHPAQKPGLRTGAGRLPRAARGVSGVLSEQFGSWRVCAAIEDRANLILEQRTFLFDDHDEVEAAGEIADDDRIERPHHPHLKKA